MLTLDDLLRGFSHTVQLHILGSLDEVADLKPQALVLVLNLLQGGVIRQNLAHVIDLLVSTVRDLLVLLCDHCPAHQDCVFVVGGDWELRDFDLSLLHVDNDFEVELKLLVTFASLPALDLNALILFSYFLLLGFQMTDEVSQMA